MIKQYMLNHAFYKNNENEKKGYTIQLIIFSLAIKIIADLFKILFSVSYILLGKIYE